PHLAIRIVHTDLTLFSGAREAAGAAQVILETGTLAVQHAPRRVHRPRDPHARLILGNPNRITGLQDDVVTRTMIPERTRQIDVDPATVVGRTYEADALRIRARRQAARALHEIRQAIVLGLQRIRARIHHLARDCDGALQFEIGLPENQQVA